MSEASEAAVLALHLADFAMNDASNKVNIVGMDVDGVGYLPGANTTTRFSVIGEVLIPSRLCPVEISVELLLLDAGGAIVELPGPAGPQKLRIGQPAIVEKPGTVAGTGVRFPPSIPARHGIVVDFGNGLPLTLGEAYTWRLRVDGDDSNARDAHFFVPGPPPAPVIG